MMLDAYIGLLLIMPFILLFWLIRPSYFPFTRNTNNPPSRVKIFGLCLFGFIVSSIILSLLIPENAAENTSGLGIAVGLMVSIIIIYLSIKQGKSTKQAEVVKTSAPGEEKLSKVEGREDKPLNRDVIKVKDKRSFFEQRQVRSDIYQRLTQMSGDGEISKEEEDKIREMLIDAELTEKQKLKGFIQAYKKAYEHIVSDDIVTDNEHESLIRIQNLFNIPSDKIAKELQLLDKHKILRQMKNGIFPSCQTSIILKKDEIAYFSYFASLIEERVVRGRYQGGSAGVSFRVAKGVSFRVGQSRGTFKSEKEPLPVSSGKLVITNQRIVFDGDKKSFNLAIGKLLGYEVFEDSVLIKPERGNPKLVKLNDASYDPDILDMAINAVIYN